jgi:hypothetical protein
MDDTPKTISVGIRAAENTSSRKLQIRVEAERQNQTVAANGQLKKVVVTNSFGRQGQAVGRKENQKPVNNRNLSL